MTPPIAIIGAGPAGLTLATLLETNHIDFIVFDRDFSGEVEGHGGSLDIHYNSGQAALRKAGLINKFKKFARYDDDVFKIMDVQGHQIFQHGVNSSEGHEEQARPEIDRKQLRSLLLDSIPSNKIRWNSRVEEITRRNDDLMSIRFANGSIEQGFKLVVGADGAWSKVRHLVTSAKPRYSGLCYFQTFISPSNPIYVDVRKQVGRGTCVALGQRKQVGTQRMGDGTYNVYAGLHISEEWTRDRSNAEEFNKRCRDLLDKEFVDWSPEVTRWFKQSDGMYYAWSLYAMPTESLSWRPVPGVTLIGDAAHVSTPFVGEGVNCSMHDALQLTQAIVKFGIQSLDEAAAEYEKSMLPRGIDLITRSNANGVRMFDENATDQLAEMFSG